jgi:hypothetical protein
MIDSEQIMKTNKTTNQWQKLLQEHSALIGNSVECCQHQNISMTTYYIKSALLAEQQPNSTLPVQTHRLTS